MFVVLNLVQRSGVSVASADFGREATTRPSVPPAFLFSARRFLFFSRPSLALQVELFFLPLFSFPTGCVLTVALWVKRAIRCLHMAGPVHIWLKDEQRQRDAAVLEKRRSETRIVKFKCIKPRGGGAT